MDSPKMSATYEAIFKLHHPRDDFRTDEAKRYTQWMENLAKDYICQNRRLIELGCAAGKQTFQAEVLGAKVIGLDYVLDALRIANVVGKDIGSNANFIRANYFFIPFASNSFDVVLYHKNLVENNYSEAEVLASEIFRVLKQEGKLILTLPDSMLKYLKYAVRDKLLDNYDLQSGSFRIMEEIPTQGKFEGISYFWTCGYAIHIFSRYLQLLQTIQIENYTYMMVFSKYNEYPDCA